MLADGRVRRLATEFACQWLHIYDFDQTEEKSEKYFPEFADIRGDMYEESIRFFTDLFQRDVSLLSLFNANHTFVNQRLAEFYGIEGVWGEDWQRIQVAQEHGRGGILALGTTLSKQSGASRTSPILRGNWISEVLLGEKLPRPPQDVPELPPDETATEGLTLRQLVALHTSEPSCASCHRRIDPFGFALEGFDAIGRRRQRDMAGRPLDTRTTLPDGSEVQGLAGLRDYLLEAPPRGSSPAVLPQTAGVRHRPGAENLRPAARHRDAAAPDSKRLSLLGGHRDDRWQPSVPGDPGPGPAAGPGGRPLICGGGLTAGPIRTFDVF